MVITVLHKPTYAILGMTRSVKRSDRYALSNLESLLILRGAGDRFTLSPTNDWKHIKFLELDLM